MAAATASQTRKSGRARVPTMKSLEQLSARGTTSSQEDTASEVEVTEAPAAPKPREKRTSRPDTQYGPEWRMMLRMMQNLSDEHQRTQRQHQQAYKQAQQAQEQLQQNLRDELRKLHEQLQQTQEQLRQTQTELQAIKEALAQPNSPRQSYATVARTPPTSQPSNIRTPSSGLTTPSTLTDTLFCTIDISRATPEGKEASNPGAIRSLVEGEMRKREGQETWKCVAVTGDGKNKDRIRVTCRKETELQQVKAILGQKTASEVRVLRDQLYPIKVDNANRTAVLDERGHLLPGAEDALGKENDVKIAKITWLSNKDNGKAYGSMAVYVTQGSDVTKLMEAQYFTLAGESAVIRPYEYRPRPVQCYNCQEIGHKAFKCEKAQRCAKCAREGHSHKDCSAEVPKCVPCGGPHESFSKNCRKLYPTSNA